MNKEFIKRLLSIVCVILLSLTSVSASDYVSLYGSVVESLAHSPLYGARVALLDSGYLELDTAIARQTMQGKGTMPAEFKLRCQKVPGLYYLMIECDGYEPLVKPLDYKRFGSREVRRELGQFILRKSPKQLSEVTVTASRIQFHNKGDTLVFNAAAFQLAEGSMLDALVNQLPGVEMTDDGNIYMSMVSLLVNCCLTAKISLRGALIFCLKI